MGGRFRCFICDGQVLSVLQEHGVEMLRPSMNAPRVDFSLVFAFAIRSAKVRRVVRNRVRATMEDETALKSEEATAWRVFEAARLGARPTEGRVPSPPAPAPRGRPRCCGHRPLSSPSFGRWSRAAGSSRGRRVRRPRWQAARRGTRYAGGRGRSSCGLGRRSQ